MLNIMKKANAMLNKVFTGLSVALLAVVIVATALQVFTRYIMNASLSGTDEVARFAFVWMSMMGASLCVRNHGHAVVSVLNDSLRNKPKAQAIHSVAVQILIMIGAAVLVVCGIQLDTGIRYCMYRIGGRLGSDDASRRGAAVGIPPLQCWVSNQQP